MSASSMSVHSLIDKFQGDQTLPERSAGGGKSAQLPKLMTDHTKLSEQQSKDRLLERDRSLDNKPDIKTPTLPPLQLTNLPTAFTQGHSSHIPFSPYKTSPTHKQPLLQSSSLASILGDDFKDNLSEEAIVEIVKLKTEQEKTRQQQIKLDIVTRNYNLLTAALNANIPSYLIPQMCVNPNEPDRSMGHSRNNSQDFGSLPLNYRFGSGSNNSTPLLSHAGSSSSIGTSQRRPLSPAKLGAQAVANLASPTSAYRFPSSKPPLIPQHQRHFSMPVESKLKTANIDLSKIESAQQQQIQHQIQQQKQYPYLQPPVQIQSLPTHTRSYSTSKGSGLSFLGIPKLPGKNLSPIHTRSKSITSVSSKGSLLGSSSTMQVKPAPAQPLQKQGKLPPSQESMTSFQHVIQFQHWKPEDPSKEYVERNHKRHKSHADNMSVDMREDYEDISMDRRD